MMRPRLSYGDQRRMKGVTIYLPEEYIEMVDLLVERELYRSRSEAIRMIMASYIYCIPPRRTR